MYLTETDMRAHLISSREELYDKLGAKTSERTLQAMMLVPREHFIDPNLLFVAYDDEAQPIPGYDGMASISQPTTVALMTDLLDPQPEDVVLEIGTATGYQAAILSHLASHVYSVEIGEMLAREAQHRLLKLGIHNVNVIIADGSWNLFPPATIDKLLITGSLVPSQLSPVFHSLKPGGICIAPIGGVEGDMYGCDMVKMRKGKNSFELLERIPGFSFVPIEGIAGWSRHIQLILTKYNEGFYESFRGESGISE